MAQLVTAVVEQGRLRPTVPLGLAEGAEVRLLILPHTDSEPAAPRPNPKDTIAAIAALPVEPGPEFAGRDHDDILYGEGGAR
jgi:hypothetical protein